MANPNAAPTAHDRRQTFTPLPRSDWMAQLNSLGQGVDIRSIVPLTSSSLIDRAITVTGLSDFGADEWRESFDILTCAIDEEAELHLAGRLLTRAEFLLYLQTRLQVVDWYKRHPETAEEPIERPIYIGGYGRSGTTILFELLSQDPQFRAVTKWEALLPVPPGTTSRDDRVERTEGINRLIEAMTPEISGLHKIGADLPVEAIELEYQSFRSEIFPMFMNVPTYAAYLRGKDLTSTFEWQKRILQLRQMGNGRPHWLLKSPSHMLHLESYRRVFPGMRVIFSHRDPVISADSVISFLGTLRWQRSDNVWGQGEIEVEVLQTAQNRARAWEPVIEMIEDGRLAEGEYANFYYHQFIEDPIAAMRSVYDQLGMTLTDETVERMSRYLSIKHKDKFGKHRYEKASEDVVVEERPLYRRYQEYFDVPDEI